MVARYVLLLLCAVAIVFGPAGDTAAQPLPEPTSRVILEVSGKIAKTNAPERARFDLKALEALGITKVTTSTPWTEGKKVFEGVRLRDLLQAVGADGTTITPVALNDYKLDIPREDFDKYPVILAYRMDGEELRVRDKGPLWIVYPRDDFPELDNRLIRSRWVWQVKELMVR
jgi:hypothetical protein